MNDLETTTERELTSDAPRMDLMMLDFEKMSALVRFSELMANSVVSLPKHFHGKPADCLAVCMQAAEWRMNPFAVAQKTHVVNGALGYEAQLVNAVLQATGAVISRPHYEYRGDAARLECRVGYVIKGETAITWNEFYCVADVKVKNSPLWATNPKQQLSYLQVKNWARQYCPGAILGIRTPDELEEIIEPKGPRRRSDGPTPMVERVDGDGVIIGAAVETKPADSPAAPPPAPAPSPASTKPPAPIPAGNAQGGISGNQVAYLRNKLKATGVAEQSICDRFQVTSIELLTVEQFDAVKSELLALA